MKAKKLLLPFLALIVMGLASSCTKEYYYPATTSHTYRVTSGDWITKAGLNYYFATFANSDITRDVFENGTVTAYVYQDGRWNQLPYVYPYYSAANDVTIGENLRFDWRTNEVTFILQDLDGFLPEGMDNIDDMTFKVCVIR